MIDTELGMCVYIYISCTSRYYLEIDIILVFIVKYCYLILKNVRGFIIRNYRLAIYMRL